MCVCSTCDNTARTCNPVTRVSCAYRVTVSRAARPRVFITRAIAVRVKVFLGNRYLNHSASIEYFLNTFIRVRTLCGPSYTKHAKSVTLVTLNLGSTSNVKILKTPFFLYNIIPRVIRGLPFTIFTIFLYFSLTIFTFLQQIILRILIVFKLFEHFAIFDIYCLCSIFDQHN